MPFFFFIVRAPVEEKSALYIRSSERERERERKRENLKTRERESEIISKREKETERVPNIEVQYVGMGSARTNRY